MTAPPRCLSVGRSPDLGPHAGPRTPKCRINAQAQGVNPFRENFDNPVGYEFVVRRARGGGKGFESGWIFPGAGNVTFEYLHLGGALNLRVNGVGAILEAGNMSAFLQGFFPPNFTDWPDYLDDMLVTIQIAVWGTVLAVILSIPFGIMSAENIVPWWIYQPVRRLMDAARAINEMVFAMMFVVAVGLGPFAGVLALFVHTTGILAKLFSEAVEAMEQFTARSAA